MLNTILLVIIVILILFSSFYYCKYNNNLKDDFKDYLKYIALVILIAILTHFLKKD